MRIKVWGSPEGIKELHQISALLQQGYKQDLLELKKQSDWLSY